MRVVTYNVGGGQPRFRDLHRVTAALRELGPQIVACQEVVEPSQAADLSIVRRLGDALGMHAVFAGNFASPRGLLGNAVLSASPVESHENLDVSLPRREPRGILHVRLQNGLNLFNVHFGLSRAERRQQWSRLLAAAGNGSSPAILCGDFNDWSGSVDREARRAGFVNVLWTAGSRQRRTFPARWPLLAIDRIYSRDLGPAAATVLRGEPWTRLSDHLPVMAELDPHELPARGDRP